jgi:hypothetical protein
MCPTAGIEWNVLSLIRLLLKLGSVFALLFAFCIALIRAQPYDDSELRAFLTPPEGCPVPCFMGIRPGVTTVDEAVAILEAGGWVDEIHFSSSNSEWAEFTWNGRQTFPVINDTRGGVIDGSEGIIHILAVHSSIPVFRIMNLLGEPNWTAGGHSGLGTEHSFGYESYGITFGFLDPAYCRGDLRDMLSLPVVFYFGNSVPSEVSANTSAWDIAYCKDLTSFG